MTRAAIKTTLMCKCRETMRNLQGRFRDDKASSKSSTRMLELSQKDMQLSEWRAGKRVICVGVDQERGSKIKARVLFFSSFSLLLLLGGNPGDARKLGVVRDGCCLKI